MATELSALSRASLSRSTFEFAKLNRPTTRAERPEQAKVDESIEREVGANKQLTDYINFLEMLRARGGQGATTSEAEESTLATVNAELSSSVEAVATSYSGVDGSALAAAVHGELHASVSGEFIGADGARFTFEATVDVSVDIAVAVESEAGAKSDPLALDLNGDGTISLSDIASGVDFDINADGVMDRTAFVQGGDGFLAVDRDGNGVINNGGELFGDQRGAANGYLELAKYDDDLNGLIDQRDSLFANLLVASAHAGGGIETRSLAAAGIRSISLAYQQVDERAAHGNSIAQRGSYQTIDGREQRSADVLLNYTTIG